MHSKKTILLGAHMSITGGFEQAIYRGESIGCTAIQIFTKSNRQWHAKEITDQEALLFKNSMSASSIKMVIAHATYLINLGSPNKLTAEKSTIALTEELRRCDQLNIPYLVVHPGSHVGSGEAACIQQVIESINYALEQANNNVTLLLETMAGQGTSICYQFESIAAIINACNFPHKIGVCLDTCHVFVAGYDFRDQKTYKELWHKFDTIIGFKKLKAIHLNDSKKELGSRVDRHTDIGKGHLGLEAFRLIMNDKNLIGIPKILETPKTTLDEDRHNMETLYELIND